MADFAQTTFWRVWIRHLMPSQHRCYFAAIPNSESMTNSELMSREATKRRSKGDFRFFFATSSLRVTFFSEFGQSDLIRISGIRNSDFTLAHVGVRRPLRRYCSAPHTHSSQHT